MAMLYLTPVLPLGLVSYMCGTTAIDLYSFAVAKIASLPLYLMYTFMGASAHSIIKGKKGGTNDSNIGKSLTDEANKLEENQFLIVSGLVLSVIMMTLITRKIKKELMKVRLHVWTRLATIGMMKFTMQGTTNAFLSNSTLLGVSSQMIKRYWISKRRKR